MLIWSLRHLGMMPQVCNLSHQALQNIQTTGSNPGHLLFVQKTACMRVSEEHSAARLYKSRSALCVKMLHALSCCIAAEMLTPAGNSSGSSSGSVA